MKVENWGLIPYAEALDRQLLAVEEVIAGGEERLIFCSHPPVVTLGRATKPEDVFAWTGDVLEIQRGGRATYHGPSQIVVYPIVRLDSRGRDISKYLRALEAAVVATLDASHIPARAAEGDATGVWIGSRKIASIGIGVKRWVTYHGLALNLDHDPSAFQGLNPCGFQSNIMTSLEHVLGKKMDRASVESRLASKLCAQLVAREADSAMDSAMESVSDATREPLMDANDGAT